MCQSTRVNFPALQWYTLFTMKKQKEPEEIARDIFCNVRVKHTELNLPIKKPKFQCKNCGKTILINFNGYCFECNKYFCRR